MIARLLDSDRSRAAAESGDRALRGRAASRPRDHHAACGCRGVIAARPAPQRSARGGCPQPCVWSWDHLSSKAIIRDVPDRLFVWNDVQKREALGHARRPARAGRGHRRAVLRSLVRSAAIERTRRVRAPRRIAGRPAVRVVGLLGAVSRQPVGGGIRDAVGGVTFVRPRIRAFVTCAS